MFGRRQYVIYEKPSMADIIGSILVVLIIAFIVGMFAAYVGLIVLFVFLGIGGAIGLVYALFVYIRAFINTLRNMGAYAPRSTGAVTGVIEKCFVLASKTASTAFFDNISVASSALTRSHAYRLLSFRKWMWLVAALSVIVIGLALIIFFILLQLFIVLMIAAFILEVFLAVCALYFVAACGYAIFFVAKFMVGGIGSANPFPAFAFRRGATFGDMGHTFIDYFASLGNAVRGMWSETMTLARDNVNDALSKPLLSLSKWLQIVSPAPLVLFAAIATALMCIVFTLIFIFAYIAQFFWTLLCIMFIH